MHGIPDQLAGGADGQEDRSEEMSNLIQVIVDPVFFCFIVSKERKKASFEAREFGLNYNMVHTSTLVMSAIRFTTGVEGVKYINTPLNAREISKVVPFRRNYLLNAVVCC